MSLKSLFNFLATFTNAHLLEEALTVDTVESTRPPSWFSKNIIVQQLLRNKSQATVTVFKKILLN